MVRSRRILAAAVQLLEQSDYQHLSIDRVAAEAGVSKATIYRWWPTKAHLGLDAVTQPAFLAGPAFEATGHLREDLVEYITLMFRLEQGEEPLLRLLTNLVQIGGDVPAGDDLRLAIADTVTRHRTECARQMFEDAVARGELPADADVDMMLDVLYGAVSYRVLFRHATTDRADLVRLVDGLLDGFAAAGAAAVPGTS
ncbi:MAG: TetR/AcrR family transcriptional regulator [Acidimicrobiaceae bacterium]|nr:TetR/AcrR family transcriptional regulator [Acidimicrobiaceae bacterium]